MSWLSFYKFTTKSKREKKSIIRSIINAYNGQIAPLRQRADRIKVGIQLVRRDRQCSFIGEYVACS